MQNIYLAYLDFFADSLVLFRAYQMIPASIVMVISLSLLTNPILDLMDQSLSATFSQTRRDSRDDLSFQPPF